MVSFLGDSERFHFKRILQLPRELISVGLKPSPCKTTLVMFEQKVNGWFKGTYLGGRGFKTHEHAYVV